MPAPDSVLAALRKFDTPTICNVLELFDAFPRTPLLMNFDEPHALAYGTGRGAGWRFDCLGDLIRTGPTNTNVNDLYLLFAF